MLNDAKLRSARPRATKYKLFDSHALYVLVTPSGSKLWRWNYSYKGKEKTLSLGIYPMVSLVDARAKRDEARRQLEDGRDPAVVRKMRVEANLKAAELTFERVAREWYKTVNSQWAQTHAGDVLRSLERDVFPHLGEVPIAELEAPLIFEVLDMIQERGSIETAKRVRQRISAVFVYAIARGYAKRDPSERLGSALKPQRKKRQPAITDLNRLRQMIREAEEDYARPVTRLALRLLALTAVRPNEIHGAAWCEFEDLDGTAPLWRIPATRMKGDQNRKEEIGAEHLVPLAPQSVAVLRALWPLTGSGSLLFPNARHFHKPMSANAIGYLLNRAGYHGHHVPHGFRAAFSTIMNEWAERSGKPNDRQIIDLMLAHVPKEKIEGAYNRAAYLARRRELARIWADMLVTGLAPPTETLTRAARKMNPARRKKVPATLSDGFQLSSAIASQAR